MLMIHLLPGFHIHSKLVSFWVNSVKHIQQQQQQLFNNLVTILIDNPGCYQLTLTEGDVKKRVSHFEKTH